MGKLLARIREPLLTAIVIGVVGQVLFTGCGSQLPDHNDSYGAPFSVGESAGWNILFTAGIGSFWLPEWILNVLVTAAVLLVGALVLKGRTVPGMIAACLAVVVAYVAYLIAADVRLPGSDYNTNQLAIWLWMLLVVMAIWGISRLRRSLNRGSPPI